MSQIKAKEFRNLSPEEIIQKKQTLEKQLYDLRIKKVSGQLDKPHLFKQLRRQRAQLNTIEREKPNA